MKIEKFETPVLEVEEIETKDIITVSPYGDNEAGLDRFGETKK